VNPQPLSATTAEDLLLRPSNGFRYELIRGELKQMTPGGYGHGVIVANLTNPLVEFVRSHRLGHVCGAETGFRISRSPDTVRAPDIAFIRTERRGTQPFQEGFFEGAPDLAVEVLSPGDSALEIEEKIADWLGAGCTVVWVVNGRRRSVALHRRDAPVLLVSEADSLDANDVLPGFALPVSRIFEW
jgi:Uma2 family endonuclease